MGCGQTIEAVESPSAETEGSTSRLGSKTASFRDCVANPSPVQATDSTLQSLEKESLRRGESARCIPEADVHQSTERSSSPMWQSPPERAIPPSRPSKSPSLGLATSPMAQRMLIGKQLVARQRAKRKSASVGRSPSLNRTGDPEESSEAWLTEAVLRRGFTEDEVDCAEGVEGPGKTRSRSKSESGRGRRRCRRASEVFDVKPQQDANGNLIFPSCPTSATRIPLKVAASELRTAMERRVVEKITEEMSHALEGELVVEELERVIPNAKALVKLLEEQGLAEENAGKLEDAQKMCEMVVTLEAKLVMGGKLEAAKQRMVALEVETKRIAEEDNNRPRTGLGESKSMIVPTTLGEDDIAADGG